MAGPDEAHSRLVGHEEAVGGLLDALFGASTRKPQGRGAGLASDVEAPLPDAAPPTAGQKINDPNLPLPDADARTDPARVMPPWAEGGFRALLFRIGEYRFAVPLVLLCSIFKPQQRPVRIPAQPPWHLGLVRYRGRSVAVADFSLLAGLPTGGSEPVYLLLIGDGDLAIACEAIEDAVVLAPDAVRWARGGSARKAWLIGLVTQEMCGLLDADALAAEIRHG